MKLYFNNVDMRNSDDVVGIFKQLNENSSEAFDSNIEFDVDINYFDYELVGHSMNEEKMNELRKFHYELIKEMRRLFENINVHINEFGLKGTLNQLDKGTVSVEIIKSRYVNHKINTIIPCKELYMYEDNLKTLDLLLESNTISEETYQNNLSILQKSMNIEIIEIDNEYLN